MRTDPSHDIWRGAGTLAPIFDPRSVAVVGATEAPGSVGRTLVQNLIAGPFKGRVYPVNPKRPSVLGVKSYPSLTALPECPDLAVIATPAVSVPAIVTECAALGVPAAIVISAGGRRS